MYSEDLRLRVLKVQSGMVERDFRGHGGGIVKMSRRHSIRRETYHYLWNRNHKPALRIGPGDEVAFDINDVWSWQIGRKTKSADLLSIDNSKLYPLAGPVYVDGAQPGDTLTVKVLDVQNDDWGWSAIFPDLGLLSADFKDPYLYKWELNDRKFAHFEKGIMIPIRPFCGVMGVAPPETGGFEVMPPGRHGGNMDIRHLTKGSKVELPVWVEGALFSTGDVHAAMGDGEVCVTAIECAGRATFRFGLTKKTGLTMPRYSTKIDEKGREYHVATGIAPDLMEAARTSVRNMLDFLVGSYGLKREDAYILCSVAADLRVHELVDKPNWVVGTMIPMDIFP
jgi:acetamidase/formamidase